MSKPLAVDPHGDEATADDDSNVDDQDDQARGRDVMGSTVAERQHAAFGQRRIPEERQRRVVAGGRWPGIEIRLDQGTNPHELPRRDDLAA